MKKAELEKIRKAVTANRGGLAAATDDQILRIWNSLAADVQKQYVDSIKPERKTDA